MGVSHQFDSKSHKTWGFISCTYMIGSVENYIIYSIWYFGHTQNSDKFCLDVTLITKNDFQDLDMFFY